jgi:hypothetical protein
LRSDHDSAGVGFLVLVVRGVLLWLTVPAATIIWVLIWPVIRRNRVRIRVFLGSVDLNRIAALHRSVFRPLTTNSLRWRPWDELPDVTHRVGLIDPA